MLGPSAQIVRRGDEQAADLAVECGVSANIAAIWRCNHAGIFDPAEPFPRLPAVVPWRKNWLGLKLEVIAVAARGQSDPRCAGIAPDTILAAHQQADAAVVDDRGGAKQTDRESNRAAAEQDRSRQVSIRHGGRALGG